MPKTSRLVEEALLIPLTGPASAVTQTQALLSGSFFESFGHPDILDAQVRVRFRLAREAGGFSLSLDFDGQLSLPCDRCMEVMDWPLSFTAEYALRRRQDREPDPGERTEDGREIIPVDAGAKEFDAAQLVYDELSLSIPIRHCHPEGGCNAKALAYLTDTPGGEEELTDTPFAALKDLQW